MREWGVGLRVCGGVEGCGCGCEDSLCVGLRVWSVWRVCVWGYEDRGCVGLRVWSVWVCAGGMGVGVGVRIVAVWDGGCVEGVWVWV